MQTRTRAAAVLAIVGFLAAGCIDESDAGHEPGTVTADHETPAAATDSAAPALSTVTATLTEWAITLSSETAPVGSVSFEIRNGGTEDHAFEVEGAGQEWKTEPIKPGEAATLSVVLEPGTYEVYCPVASGGEAHADRGMRTTFTVR